MKTKKIILVMFMCMTALMMHACDAETDAEINGTFSTDDDSGKTYLTIGEEKYLKL